MLARVGGEACHQCVGKGMDDDVEVGGEAPHRCVGVGIVDDAEVGGEAPQFFVLLWCRPP